MTYTTKNRFNQFAISYSTAIVLPSYQRKLLLLLLLIKTSRSVVSQAIRFNLKNIFTVLDNLSLNQALAVVHLWPDRSILMRKFVVLSVDVLIKHI